MRKSSVKAMLGLAAMVATAGCGAAIRSSTPSTTGATGLSQPTVGNGATITTTNTATTNTATGPFQQRRERSMPEAIQESGAAVANDHLYVIGGYDIAKNSVDTVFVFDGAKWKRGQPLPVALNHPGVTSIGNDVYVGGGFTAKGASNRVFRLASGASTWKELPALQRARGALALGASRGKLYAIGGRDATLQIAIPESFDPTTNAWHDLPAMPNPRNHLAPYIKGTLVCVAGGRTPATSSALDCFDTASGSWRGGSPLPTATSGASAMRLGDATLIAGGEPSAETSVLGVIQILRAGAWSSVPMLVARHGAGTATFRGRVWLCGGATAPGFHAVSDCTSIGN